MELAEMMMESEGKVLKKKPYRRFRPLDCEAIARLVAQRHTEQSACELLDIKLDTFQKWRKKGGNESFYIRTFTRARANILNSHLENIEDASKGKGVHAKADWRASKALIDHSFPELLPQQNTGQVTNNTLNIAIMHDALKRVIGIVEPQMPLGATLIEKPCPDMAETPKAIKSASRIPARQKMPTA